MVPTVTVLAVMKSRLLGATKGHALLKKKADALSLRFRQILKNIVNTKEQMGKVMKESFFALAQARYAAGEFRHTVLDGVDQARVGPPGAHSQGGSSVPKSFASTRPSSIVRRRRFVSGQLRTMWRE